MAPVGELNGKVALVTGAGRGIGRAIATALGSAGAVTVCSSRTEAEVKATAKSIRESGGTAHAIAFDLSGESAPELVRRVISSHGSIDIVAHAAGNQVRRPTLEFSLEEFDVVLDVHLRAAFTLCKEAVGHMVQSGSGGCVILVGSMTSIYLGHPTTVAYNVAKSGLLGLARTLAVEFARANVRANVILPGFIATSMASEVSATPERQALVARIPLGRCGAPSDVGGVAAFLASEAACYITGQAIAVDGGWSVA